MGFQERAQDFFKSEPDVNVIELIHEDFDNAADEFLTKANEILAEGTKEMKPEVQTALENFGFKRAKDVVEIKEAAKAKAIAKDVAEKVSYFFEHYPFNKFITREQVKDICKKYGLVFGKTEWYVGDIPEKNQMEIAGFEVRDEDKVDNQDIMIVATKDEFDTKGLNLSDGWELKELPKDPIVLYPVSGGYLIVSKWGLEADLDEVQ
jgi:hypothetical protein